MLKFYPLAIILLFFQFNSLAQNDGNVGLHLNSTDNSTATFEKESNEYLVVFKSPCLLEEFNDKLTLKSASAIQPIKIEHERFISDLSAIRKVNSGGLKSASITVVKQELFRVINASVIESNEEEIAKIKSLDYVKAVIKNEKISMVREPFSGNQLLSAARLVGATNSEDGKGVTVGVIDSGIDYNNPALGGGYGSGFKVAGGYDFVNNDNDPMDDDGHGTSVAGVIAADGQPMGIAPKATLYAYKVMNAWGWGWSNNVYSALEYCVDPNQDFNFSDHLDIVNMSIALYFMLNESLVTYSDIFARMANLKMIVCVAAGNEGPDYLRFNAFSVSENVLSVGSCNSNNYISTFSSRGFGINNYGIKPDIVARGENVKTLSLLNSDSQSGGTSIASPGVAGVAALLKQKHRDWTYNQIKSALMNSSDALAFNVMEQGAGKVNRDAALNQTTVVFPQTINWGIASENNGIIKKTFLIKVSNTSQDQQKYTFDLGKDLAQGIVITSDVSSIIVNSNESVEVEFSLTINQDQLTYPNQIPFNYYGWIKIYGTKDFLQIPWTLLRGCEIKIISDIKFTNHDAQILKILRNGQQINSNVIYDPSNVIVVPPGRYDILFKANDGNRSYPFTDTIKGYFYIKENVEISGSANFDLSKAVIKNKINLQSADGIGNPLSDKKMLKNKSMFEPIQISYDFMGIKSKFNPLEPIIYNCNYDEYYINDFDVSENYKLIAGDYKARIAEKSDFFVVNYEVNQTINDNLNLQNPPSSLYPYTFIFYPFPGTPSNYSISGGSQWSGTGCTEIPLNETTKSTLWIEKKKEGSYDLSAYPMLSTKDALVPFGGVRMFELIYSYGDSIQIKSLRSPYREVFQTINKDDTVFVNNGPVYYSLNISSRYNYKFFDCYSYLKGMYGERDDIGFSKSLISIVDLNNKVVYQNTIGKYNDEPYTGSLNGAKMEISTSDYFINGRKGIAFLRYEMKADPPNQFTSIQSLQFLNDRNQLRSAYKIGSSARMNLVVNNAHATNSIKLFFKLSDETDWKERSFSLKKNQFDENIIDTDLSDLLTKSIGLDFKIEAEDTYLNKMSYTLEPAIVIGDYHENHDFKLHEIPDTIVFKNTVVKKKVNLDAFFPEFHRFNWSASVIKGSGSIQFNDDSIFITPSTDFSGKLTAQIKGIDGKEKDSILVTVNFNTLNDASFYVNPEYQNGELVGQIGTTYFQKNMHYRLVGDASPAFSLDSLFGKLFVKDKEYLYYQDHRQITLQAVAMNGVEGDTAMINVFVKTKPIAFDSTFEIAEGNPIGTMVGLLKASDEDGDTLSYHILAGDKQGVFAINESTGSLHLKTDIGSVGKDFYLLTWQASDGLFNSDIAYATINVSKPTSARMDDLNRISIFPNPGKGIFSIDNIILGSKLEVYNSNCNTLLYEYLITGSERASLNLSHLPSGVYILKITNKNAVNSYKIIKL